MPAGPSGAGNAEAASGGGGGGSTGGDEDRGFDFMRAGLGFLTGGPFGAAVGGFNQQIRDAFGNVVSGTGTPGPDFGGVGGPGLESDLTQRRSTGSPLQPGGATGAFPTSLAGLSPEDIQRLGQQIQFDFLNSVQGEFFPGGAGGPVDTTSFFPGQTFAGLNEQQTGALTQQQEIANQLLGDPQGQTVRQAFTEFLGRDPGIEGITFWTNQLKSGVPLEQVRASIAASPEAQEFTSTGVPRPVQPDQVIGPPPSNIPGLTQQAIQFGLEGVLQPGANPFFQESIQAALRPVTEQFVNQVLPNLGSAAQQAGAFGGSRQGQLEAQVTSDFTRNLGDISSQLARDQFNRQLTTFERTQALLPTTLASTLFPSQVLAGVGDVFQGQEQLGINEAISRFNFGENIAGARLGEAGQLLSQGGGGFAAGPTTPGTETGGFVGAIGGASSALGILGTFNQITGGTSSAGVAGAAAGLGALFGLFS